MSVPQVLAGASWHTLICQVLNGKGLSPGSKVCAHHYRLLSLAAVPCRKLGNGLSAPVQGHIPMVAASGQLRFLQVTMELAKHF